MPPITRTFIKTGLLYFVTALLASLLVAGYLPLGLPVWVAGLSPVYFHLFLVGWVTHLIIGVAYWMFPKFTKAQPRGSDTLAWSVYGLLNSGLLLRVIAEPLQGVQPRPLWGWLLIVSAGLQWLGGLAFVINTWPRVKEK
ncbi:MAG: hypothetical protein R3E79_13670 [Caldilineaceae bacterium]